VSLILVGTNHKYSPIAIRERLSFSKRRLQEALKALVYQAHIDSSVILSTCNRVELYAGTGDPALGVEVLKRFLADYHQEELSNIESYLYTYIGKEAVRHLFNVAGGIDSQIIGEPQILQQVSLAFKEAKMSGCTDGFIDSIFSYAIETGKRVRVSTQISSGEISIGSIAIRLIKDKFGDLKSKKILIIGVGKVSELVSEYLKKEITSSVIVSNRTFDRAGELARYIGGEAVKFDQLKERLKESDIVITATASPHLILKKEDILEVLNYRLSTNPACRRGRDYRLLLIIDLAVPRDIDPEARNIAGVELYSLDDLSCLIEESLKARREEIPKAEGFIESEVENLWRSKIEAVYELQAVEAHLP